MAIGSRPAKAGKVSSGISILRGGSIFVLMILVMAGMTTGANGPRFESAAVFTGTFAVASIDYDGTDPVITGSVGNLFQSSGFVGPNRADKTDRARPEVDLMTMATAFNDMRVHLASLEEEPFDPAAPQSRVSTPGAELATGEEEGPRMSLANVDPSLASSALSAIDEVTPRDPSIPVPLAVPEQLAYARANTPATERVVNSYSTRERWCLATAIYFEARGEAYRGQVGVAQVVMNRVAHRLYPDTICGVVFQNQTWRNRCQFSFACDGIPERVNEDEPWKQAEAIADQVTSGSLYLPEVANATHYHASYVYPHWAPRMTRVTRIGAHIFYRFRSS